MAGGVAEQPPRRQGGKDDPAAAGDLGHLGLRQEAKRHPQATL